MKYAVVFERAKSDFAAYVPDLPGVFPPGKTREEIERNIRVSIEFHIDGLRGTGRPVPPPTARVETIETFSSGIGPYAEAP